MKNTLKTKLRNNTFSIGTWLTLAHSSVAEILAQAGFEWITIDMEHSVINLDQLQSLIQVIEKYGVVPLVRVGENDPNLIKRIMDAGAYGIIVAMVNCKNDAQKAVNAIKYPPQGSRGVGLARAQGYGFNFQEYSKTINKNSVFIAQIEHIDAVNNLDEILSVEGLDGCIVGPYDLSGSLGIPGKYNDPRVKDALKIIEEKCREYKMPLGFHVIEPDHNIFLEYCSKGYTFLAFSLDTIFLGTICRRELEEIKKGVN